MSVALIVFIYVAWLPAILVARMLTRRAWRRIRLRRRIRRETRAIRWDQLEKLLAGEWR